MRSKTPRVPPMRAHPFLLILFFALAMGELYTPCGRLTSDAPLRKKEGKPLLVPDLAYAALLSGGAAASGRRSSRRYPSPVTFQKKQEPVSALFGETSPPPTKRYAYFRLQRPGRGPENAFRDGGGENMVDGQLRRATALNWTKKGIKPKRKRAPRPLVDVAAFNQRKRLSANGSLPRAVQKEFAKLALPPRSTSLPKRPKRFSPWL